MASRIRPNGRGFRGTVPVPRSTFAGWINNPKYALHTNVRKDDEENEQANPPFQLRITPNQAALAAARELG